MYERILVALDGSELAERILPYAAALAEKFGGRLTLLHVATPEVLLTPGGAPGGVPTAVPMVNPEPVIEAERQALLTYLELVADRLRGQGVDVEYEQIEGPAVETILERARELPADLIAMTTHGRGGLSRLVFGSVADAVLRGAPCPILLVRVSGESAPPEAARAPRKVDAELPS